MAAAIAGCIRSSLPRPVGNWRQSLASSSILLIGTTPLT